MIAVDVVSLFQWSAAHSYIKIFVIIITSYRLHTNGIFPSAAMPGGVFASAFLLLLPLWFVCFMCFSWNKYILRCIWYINVTIEHGRKVKNDEILVRELSDDNTFMLLVESSVYDVVGGKKISDRIQFLVRWTWKKGNQTHWTTITDFLFQKQNKTEEMRNKVTSEWMCAALKQTSYTWSQTALFDILARKLIIIL